MTNDNNNGFTLIEILVALALTGIVMGAIYSAYHSQQKTYIIQESVAEMQQNLRAAMYLMTREIRMAGYDPRGTASAGITYISSQSVRITKDENGNGAIDAQDENVTYSLNSNNLQRVTTDGVTTLGPFNFAGNIETIDFVCLDEDDNVTTTASDIRSVQITIVARTGRSDPDYNHTFTYNNLQNAPIFGPGNDGFHRKALSTQVKCRNLGLGL